MTEDEVREKYRSNAKLSLGSEAVQAVEDAVMALGEQSDLSFLAAVRS